jgi:hypothetical protein
MKVKYKLGFSEACVLSVFWCKLKALKHASVNISEAH